MPSQPEWSRFQLPTRVTQARSPGRGSPGSESDQVAAAPPGQSHWHPGISLAGPGRRGRRGPRSVVIRHESRRALRPRGPVRLAMQL